MSLLGFYLAEGSCSDRNGVRLSIGKSNVRFLDEMAQAFTRFSGCLLRTTNKSGAGELKLVISNGGSCVAARVGFSEMDSITKRIPDLVFNVSEPLRLAFFARLFF